MAKKASNQGSKATLKQLRADLSRSEAKRAEWKKRAKQAERAVADLQRRPRTVAEPKATPKPETTTAEKGTGPDSSWTVVQLRAEARRRGITGLSGKPKAELVAALS